MSQSGFGGDALPPVQPAKSRLLITLVVDTSGSMASNGRIGELNAALQNWRSELAGNDHVRRHGEIAMVTFGPDVTTVDPSGRATTEPDQPYVPVSEFSPPPLAAGGFTPMVKALQRAFDLLSVRRDHLRSNGHNLVNRSLVYLLTDGVPTDDRGYRSDGWMDFAPVIRQQENAKHLLFFAFGVDGADQNVLGGLAPQSSRMLRDCSISEVLTMVSTSVDAAASSTQDETAGQAYARVNDQMDRMSRIRDFLIDND